MYDGQDTCFRAQIKFIKDVGKMNTILSLIPQDSNVREGLKFKVYSQRFSKFFNISEDETNMILPKSKKE
jgi:hypothetical protein